MRIKTIVIVLVTVLLTVLLMQNSGPDRLDFLWADFRISKLLLLAIVAGIGFVLGYLVGRPKRIRRLGDGATGNELEQHNPDTLSDEDREYIN